MILANVCVATYMLVNDIPGIFRNHAAKAAAPAAAALAETIKTWVATGNVDAADAQAKFAAVMGKAEYSSVVMAHYALAEPVYAHVTSPLRRYPDLVNLRQLRAHLKAQPYPHSAEKLSVLAEQMNTAAAARKEERSKGFKTTVARNAENALARGRLDRLADHELRQAVRIEVSEHGTLSESMAGELVRRFEASILTDRFVDVLLAEVPHEAVPSEVLEAFAAWTRLIPTRAVNLLMHAQDNGYLTALAITSDCSSTAFVGSVTLSTPARAERAFQAEGVRKRDAEQAAAVEAIHWLLQVESPAAEQALETPPGAAKIANPKGRLLELCQQRGWPSPDFVVKGQGHAHAMVFTATARLVAAGRLIEQVAGPAANKKEAEAQASAKLLASLSQHHPTPSAPTAPPAPVPPRAEQVAPRTSPAIANPVGALQELAMKGKFQMPEYQVDTVSLVPPLFRAKVMIYGPVVGSFSAEATTKQGAKTEAARKAML